ncbi:MAG: antiterminator LoaP [Spirochaetales bacterium]|uniref:Antiterminator LoaP n=1 Tax=Candidatus Thalassospirochaeta sargassi TaxID=3119039 RepID=A0AAJ1IJL0_9SPIO|nr:antiterminator LoaP [Spirochaetales bacterium]
MKYFAVQVRSGKEEHFLELARQNMSRSGYTEEDCARLFWPRRSLRERRRGVVNDCVKPLYPGYIFYMGEEISPDLHWILRRSPGFSRFLKDNRNIEPLTENDREILTHFLRFGEVTGRSKVYFDENNRIVVVSGPMSGLEGIIERVDRRKGRAKIRLSLNNNSMLVDLAFDVIKSAEEKNGK